MSSTKKRILMVVGLGMNLSLWILWALLGYRPSETS